MKQQMRIISIPDDLDFADLKLAYDPDGMISFDLSVIEKICEASGVPVEFFTETIEDNVAGLINTWYRAHIEAGGDPDPVAEDIIAEVIAEDKTGQKSSHKPGRA